MDGEFLIEILQGHVYQDKIKRSFLDRIFVARTQQMQIVNHDGVTRIGYHGTVAIVRVLLQESRDSKAIVKFIGIHKSRRRTIAKHKKISYGTACNRDRNDDSHLEFASRNDRSEKCDESRCAGPEVERECPLPNTGERRGALCQENQDGGGNRSEEDWNTMFRQLPIPNNGPDGPQRDRPPKEARE